MFNTILSRMLRVRPLVNIIEESMLFIDKQANKLTKEIIFFYSNHNPLSLKTFKSQQMVEGAVKFFLTLVT